ncbi:hypothetical protein Q4610_11125 [Sphingobium sp. HBC34]|uniref:Peptidase S10 n=1 Tax=Sphingobium cyanobacteriorum TaxID=3063954 RepID=A0ABT8ZM44_9SPHN|nr:hypothetical protein [Sphingobium sp. HBC34]MDO7835595.1 hypothetical protein [Sphingobium sp. HBC34]
MSRSQATFSGEHAIQARWRQYGAALLLLSCCAAALARPVLAQPAPSQPAPSQPAASVSTWPAPSDRAISGPRHFSKVQSGTFNARRVRYHVLLDEVIVRDRQGRDASSVFTTAFVADGKAASDRPVVIVFNGGPGAASNMLMFGALGPRRMVSLTTAAMADPATPVVANDDTILDVADLLFYDPPETGYGRPVDGADPLTFRSSDGDSHAAAQTILHWLVRHGRIASPVYLVGESYGTHRAVMLARDLRNASPQVKVAGLVLVSQALTYNGPPDRAVRGLPDPARSIVRLPDAVPLAWYHGLIDNRTQTLEQAVHKARDYAYGDYASALLRGNRLSQAERAGVASRLEQIIGLPAAYFLAHDLRMGSVRRDLLASRGLALGQFDGRETEPLNGTPVDRDRDWTRASAGITHAMEAYVAGMFGQTGLPAYRSIVPDPYGFEDSWRYIAPPGPGLDVVLDEQLALDPALRVMMTFGVFDATSSLGATEYLVSQLPHGKGRVNLTYYPGGHMLYSDLPGLKALTADIRAFVTGQPVRDAALPEGAPAR